MSQQIEETGWGKKVLPGTNNLFNIKADPSWKGKKKKFRVKEHDKNGKEYYTDEWFRVYDDPDQSAKDYAKFLLKNKRYRNLFGREYLTSEQGAIELQRAGYATNPNYADNIINVMNGRTFQQLSNTLGYKFDY